MWIFDSLNAIRHERELSLLPTCRVIAAENLIYSMKFKLIWFKIHDFSAIDIIIKTKQVFFAEYLRKEL